MERKAPNPQSELRTVSLKPYLDKIRPSFPKKEADMVVTITGLLERFLGPGIGVPNRSLLWDLAHRFSVWLRDMGYPGNTVKNYAYRLRQALSVICRDSEDLKGLDSPPSGLPTFPTPEDKVGERLHLAYRLHREWRMEQGIAIDAHSKSVFKQYQRFLLSKANCSYTTARIRYGDLRTFWETKAKAWELPMVEIPEMPTSGTPRIGLVKDNWPSQIREEFDWFFRCCRGQEQHVPFVVRRRKGKASETNLESDLRLYLGYLANVRGEDIERDDLHSILNRKQDVKAFLDWHRENRANGRAATIHQRILRDFATLLVWVWGDPTAKIYHDWASQLRVDRVRPKFHETIDDHGRLLAAVQEALEKVESESTEFKKRQMSGASRKTILDMASRYQDVLMFALFSLAPLRESNMVGLEIGRSLIQVAPDRYEIRINSIQFKSKRPFAIQFPTMLVKHLETFIKNWRPHLNLRSDDLLYHTRAGGPLRPKAVNERMICLSKELLDLRVNPHHFRMLVASAYLAEHPEDFEQIRQLLGHKFIKTSIDSYTHVFCLAASRKATQFARETSPAFKALGELVMRYSTAAAHGIVAVSERGTEGIRI